MMIELEFDPISSALIAATGTGGTRDYQLALKLEPEEDAQSVEVVSSNTDALTISNAAIGADDRSVIFSVTIAANTPIKLALIYIAYVGTTGSSDTYRCKQPIVDYITS